MPSQNNTLGVELHRTAETTKSASEKLIESFFFLQQQQQRKTCYPVTSPERALHTYLSGYGNVYAKARFLLNCFFFLPLTGLGRSVFSV